ncbi:MAG: Calx-beta domain-containing protein [Gimesia sp.]|nr:Calx-beta domain-containing protein [Gimesia sp.]
MSLFSYFKSRLNRNSRRKTIRNIASSPCSISLEQLEPRLLLSADMPESIAALSDEFDDSSTINDWQRVYQTEGWSADQLNVWDVNQSQAGRMVMQPHTVVWFDDWRGPMVYKEVTGDFVITSQIHITDRDEIGGSDSDNVPGDGQFSLGGVMVRTPRDITDPLSDWAPGSRADDGTNDGENYVFLSFGYAYANGANEFGLEVKTTRNSASQLEVIGLGQDINTITVQTARIGDSIITMYQIPGQAWQVRDRFSRPDMPETLQVGLVTYTDWEKANDFDPLLHNNSALTPETITDDPSNWQPYNPDLTAAFEYARYASPDVPAELQGVDLTDNAISDAQLLSFLGNNANLSPDGTTELTEVIVEPITERIIESGAGEIEAFVIRRSGGNNEAPLIVNIGFSGTAVINEDFSASATTSVVIPAGSDSTTVFLESINDSEEERAETILLSLISGNEYLIGQSSEATISLRDDDSSLAVGMNLERHVDWGSAWIFKDAFLRARPWGALAYNPLTGAQMWQYQAGDGPAIQVDEQGWIAELPTWVAADGIEYQQIAQSVIFTGAVEQPAGIYRAEWDGTGEVAMPFVIETGTTSEGRNYALVDMPAGAHFAIDIRSIDPSDPIRNINLWMPDYNGESLVMEDWQPGDTSSPFHPLFLERLAGFDTIRFMDWQMTNYNAEVDTWNERSQLTHASQGDATSQGYYDYTVNGVALEYMIQLANELGANPWFNMPYAANDEFVLNFATTVRDHLDPELEAYVEWSNELWNGFFPVNGWIGEQTTLPENSGLGFFEIAAQEIGRDFDIWSDVFTGQEDRIVRVVAGQQNNPWVLEQLLANLDGRFDAVSSTAYAGLADDFAAAADEYTTADEIIDSLLEVSIPWSRDRMIEHREIADQYEELLGRDIQYVTYESGSHVFAFNSPLYGTSGEAAGVEAMYSPRMYDVYQSLLNEARDAGVDLYNEFTFTSHYGASPYGSYGLLYSLDQPLETAHQYQSILDFMETQQNPVVLPQVIVNTATDSVQEDQGELIFTFQRLGAPLDQPLTVYYSLEGTAASGIDFTPPVGMITFAAGENEATLTLTTINDNQVEGTESIEVHLLESEMYLPGDASSSVATILDDDFESIGSHTFSHALPELNIDLPESHPDGTLLEYTATLVISELSNLDQQHDFFTDGNYHENWGGLNERWIRGGDDQWFYLTPNGNLNRWEGSFQQSQLLAELDPSVYEDPMQLIDVIVPANVIFDGNQLSINPLNGFIGNFEIDMTVSNGSATQSERITIEVINGAPVISEISNQLMTKNQGVLQIPIDAHDPDGDELTLSAFIVDPHYQLDQEHGFWNEGDFYTNWGDHQEKWIRDNNSHWHYLLPNGELYRWSGDFETSSLVATLTPETYDDPTLLTDAQPIAVNVSMDGNSVLIDSQNDFVGSFQVAVVANDGTNLTTQLFTVEITNIAPIMAPFTDQELFSGEELQLDLNGFDADGDDLTYTVAIEQSLEYQLDQSHGFTADGNYYTNWGGQQEKWIRDNNNAWHYILPNGELYSWGGSFESSTLVASLSSDVYDTPTLLTDAQPIQVTAEIDGTSLRIQSADNFTGNVQVAVTVSDGTTSITYWMTVQIIETLDPLDMLYSDLELMGSLI